MDFRTLISDLYDRALVRVSREDVSSVRRAFRRAYKALDAGDTRPAVLLIARWA